MNHAEILENQQHLCLHIKYYMSFCGFYVRLFRCGLNHMDLHILSLMKKIQQYRFTAEVSVEDQHK